MTQTSGVTPLSEAAAAATNATFETRASLMGAPVAPLAWSPRGDRVAWGSGGDVHIYSVPLERIVTSFQGSTPVNALAFSRDGSLLAGGYANGGLRLWRQHNRPVRGDKPEDQMARERWTMVTQGLVEEARAAGISHLAFSPREAALAIAFDNRVQLLRVLEQELVAYELMPRGRWATDTGTITAAAFPDRLWLVAGSDTGNVSVFSLVTERGHLAFNIGTPVTAMAASRDGTLVAIGSGEPGVVRLYRAEDGDNELDLQQEITVSRTTDTVVAIAFLAGKDWLALSRARGTASYTVHVQSGTSGSPMWTASQVSCVGVFETPERIVTGRDDGSVRIHDARSGSELAHITSETGPLQAVAGFGNIVVTVSKRGLVERWDIGSGSSLVRTTLLSDTDIVSFSLVGGGRGAVVGTASGEVQVWDLEVGECLAKATAGRGAAQSLAVHYPWDDHVRAFVAAGGSDGLVQVWELNTALNRAIAPAPDEAHDPERFATPQQSVEPPVESEAVAAFERASTTSQPTPDDILQSRDPHWIDQIGQLLQSLAMALHVRTLAPHPVETDEALAAAFGATTPAERADFVQVRVLAEYLFTGPVKKFMSEGSRAFPRVDQQTIAGIEAQIQRARDGQTFYEVRRMFQRTLALATSEERAALSAALGSDDPAKLFDVNAERGDSLSEARDRVLNAALQPPVIGIVARYHSGIDGLLPMAQPTSLAHLPDFPAFFAAYCKLWLGYAAHAAAASDAGRVLELGYPVEAAALHEVQRRYPDAGVVINDRTSYSRDPERPTHSWRVSMDRYADLVAGLAIPLLLALRQRLASERPS